MAGVRPAGEQTGKQRIESYDTLIVRELHTAEERVIERILSVNTRVRAGAVAVPHIGRQLRDRQAGGDINKLHLDVQRDTALALGDVRPDELPYNVVRPDSRLGHQHARVVAAKDSRLGGRGRVVHRGCPVVVDLHVLQQFGHIALQVAERPGRQPALSTNRDGLAGTALGGAALEVACLGRVLARGEGAAAVRVRDVAQCHLVLDVLLGDARVRHDHRGGGRQKGEES